MGEEHYTTYLGQNDTAIVLNMLPLKLLFINCVTFKVILGKEIWEQLMEGDDPMSNEQIYIYIYIYFKKVLKQGK